MRALLAASAIALLCTACSVAPTAPQPQPQNPLPQLAQANARPTGKNCNLTAPPAESGEEDGHGAFMQIYPRNKDIGTGYSGCQAVFGTKIGASAQLAWLTQVVDGDAVRVWSTDESLQQQMDCRYRRGKVVQGDAKLCKGPLLLPSMPAGCMTGTLKGAQCSRDGE